MTVRYARCAAGQHRRAEQCSSGEPDLPTERTAQHKGETHNVTLHEHPAPPLDEYPTGCETPSPPDQMTPSVDQTTYMAEIHDVRSRTSCAQAAQRRRVPSGQVRRGPGRRTQIPPLTCNANYSLSNFTIEYTNSSAHSVNLPIQLSVFLVGLGVHRPEGLGDHPVGEVRSVGSYHYACAPPGAHRDTASNSRPAGGVAGPLPAHSSRGGWRLRPRRGPCRTHDPVSGSRARPRAVRVVHGEPAISMVPVGGAGARI